MLKYGGWIFERTKKNCGKKNLPERHKKIQLSLEKFIYLECTEIRGDNGKG